MLGTLETQHAVWYLPGTGHIDTKGPWHLPVINPTSSFFPDPSHSTEDVSILRRGSDICTKARGPGPFRHQGVP